MAFGLPTPKRGEKSDSASKPPSPKPELTSPEHPEHPEYPEHPEHPEHRQHPEHPKTRALPKGVPALTMGWPASLRFPELLSELKGLWACHALGLQGWALVFKVFGLRV